MWLDDGMSGLFAVEQGLREGWVLALLLFNILFVAVIYVAYNTRFKAEKDTTDTLVHLGRNRGRGSRGKQPPESRSPGDADLGHDSRLPCRGNLAITREAEEDDGRDRGLGCGFWSPYRRSRLRSCVYARRECRRPPPYIRIPRGERQPQRRFVHRGRSVHTQRTVQLPAVHSRNVRPTDPLELKIWMLRAGVLETMLCDCVT